MNPYSLSGTSLMKYPLKAESLGLVFAPEWPTDELSVLDMQSLVWLSRLYPGNILEIGCGNGLLLMNLALHNRNKNVVGIDNRSPSCGYLAESVRNVRMIKAPFDKWELDEGGNFFSFVVIRLFSVTAITHKVLTYFLEQQCATHPRALVWTSSRDKETRSLLNELSKHRKITHIADTSVAYTLL